MSLHHDALEEARRLAEEFLDSLPGRPVHATAAVDELRSALTHPLSDNGVDETTVLRDLAAGASPGLIGSAGPRYFGYVIGGSLPVALGADLLVSAWDQNSGIYSTSPAVSVIEEIAATWLLDLLQLPPAAGVGFVTGGQMANTTALAAARHGVLARVGWNVEERGLNGAPKIDVVVSDESHITIFAALRLLGLGSNNVKKVDVDAKGRMRAAHLREVIATCDGPTIVCAQAGNVNTGAFDPIGELAEIAHARNAWLHVDGAFGLWARASKAYRALADGIDAADSWATDAHKWLNVPYDCGVTIVADRDTHRAAMRVTAAYLEQTVGAERDPIDWVPEFSRRARAVPVYAALRHLGRIGVAELVDRCCRHAGRFAELLRADGVELLADVVLNQTLVRFHAAGRDSDEVTRAVIRAVQDDGTCWLSGTTWQGVAAMRISVSNWWTSDEDVERSAAAIRRAHEQVSAAPPRSGS